MRATTGLLLAAGCAAVLACTRPASASEVCRFAGTTDYAGHLAVTTDVSAAGDVIRVDVVLIFEAAPMPFLAIRYLIEEISTWRAGEMQSVAVNTRYLFGDSIVRQQWDDFQRGPDGLQARRVQAKTLDDFRLRHPGFVAHWDPATFGRPWLEDYPSATPERRPDLDLGGSSLSPGLRSPFAMAFYWVRFLPPGGGDVPVFLPGFKADRLADLPIVAAPAAGGMLWHAPLRYPALTGPSAFTAAASNATAVTLADRHLLQLAFEVHSWLGAGQGLIHQEGCEGVPVVPADRPR